MYQPRTYRHWIKGRDLVSFDVVVKETDLHIRAPVNLTRPAYRLVRKYRNMLERYIDRHPLFLTTLEPLAPADDAPRIVKAMSEATAAVGVGPMAAVAGAIAQFVGEELLAFTSEVIIENGGDIYLKTTEKRVVGIYAGDSPLTGKLGLEVQPDETPLGICTSSGTVGHSLSLGKADAVVILAQSAILADAAATAVGNIVVLPEDINRGIELARSVQGLKGVVIIVRSVLGAWGDIRLCETDTA